MRSILFGLLVIGTIPVCSSAIAKSWLSKLPSNNICSVSPSEENCQISNSRDTVNLKSGMWLPQIANILLLPKRRLNRCWNQSSLINQQNSVCLLSWKGLPNINRYSKQIRVTSNLSASFDNRKKLEPKSRSTSPLKQFPRLSRSSLIVSSPRNLTSLCSTSIKETNGCVGVKNLKLSNPAPATKRIASPFGWRKRPYSGQMQFHKGIDYGAPLGTPVVAAANGIVINVVSGCADFGNRYCGSQFGNWIEIDHGSGKVATYGHLLNKSITVKKGMKVWKNQEIAKVGSSGWSTGAHLDFRLKINGNHQNPADYVN